MEVDTPQVVFELQDSAKDVLLQVVSASPPVAGILKMWESSYRFDIRRKRNTTTVRKNGLGAKLKVCTDPGHSRDSKLYSVNFCTRDYHSCKETLSGDSSHTTRA